MISELNGLAGSAFVALVLALVACIALWRLVTQLLDKIDKQWIIISQMADGMKDNNAITARALDMVERVRG